MSLGLGGVGAILVVSAWSAMGFAIWASGRGQTRPSASGNTPQQLAATENRSAVDLNDVKALDEKYGIEAASACDVYSDDYIRAHGEDGFKWDRSMLGLFGAKFDKYQPLLSMPGVMTLRTDKLTAQKDSGSAVHVTFYCRYDTQARKVLGYEIR